jgi:D-aspartate ligase
MGDTDLLYPLARAGVRSVVVGRADGYASHSRHQCGLIPGANPLAQAEALLERMLAFAHSQRSAPVLLYQSDADLLFTSRHRERLSEGFRFVLPEPHLVEDLVDKGRFSRLTTRLALPAPRSVLLRPDAVEGRPELELDYPLVIKPLTRDPAAWRPISGNTKALLVASPQRFEELWPRLSAARLGLMAQELVPGAETRIESYHAYVDRHGAVAGEFTGEKVRTQPPALGHSTALRITTRHDVTEAGRTVLRSTGLQGVVKVDFKRGPDGRLWLLEANPRFNLWHWPGAVAGVNLPAIVYADLAGFPRPTGGQARAGVTWCEVIEDFHATRAAGLPIRAWLRFVMGSETRHAIAWDDPMPFLRGMLLPYLGARLQRVAKARGRPSRR